jgi:O-antigen/teichoic acid export membrane protein
MNHPLKALPHAWSLADQVLVSGCNFLLSITLARLLGVEDFGIYFIAQMYLFYGNTFQQSLVSAPMMTAIPSEKDASKRPELVSGFFACSVAVLVAVTVLVPLIAWLLGEVLHGLNISQVRGPMILALPAFLLQDWLRRYLYIETKMRQVFLSDFVAYLGQLVAIIYLHTQEALSASTALGAMAFTFSIASLLVIFTQCIRPSIASGVTVIRAYAHSGCNLLVASQLQWLAASGAIMLGTGIIGAKGAGGIRAAQNLMGPINVVFQWMENIVPTRLAIVMREQGRSKMRTYFLRLILFGSLGMSLLAFALMFVDEWLITLVYGENYLPFAPLIVLFSIYFLFGYSHRMLSYWARVYERTADLVRANLCWFVISLIVLTTAVHALAEHGIMLALIFGQLGSVIYLVRKTDLKN